MRRVVVTGLGVVSSIGTNADEVTQYRAGKSGISFEEYKEMGFRSHLHGDVDVNLQDRIDRKLFRFMGDGAAYNYLAMEEAIADAGLETADISNPKPLIMGSGGPRPRI